MNILKEHSKTNALVAALVFVISFIVYLKTMAPSICLWDCGEYMAAAGCLGLPHPPGTPLLVMLGRAWVVLVSFIGTFGYRFNLIAVVSSSVVVLFIYLITVRGLIFVIGEPDTLWKRLTVYCSGFVAGLFCAFGKTFWFAALEMCQQSNVTNITVVMTIWLSLVWAQSKREDRDRYLLLISYIAFVGVGLRMISMLTMPVVFAFIMIVDPEKRRDWRLWVAACLPVIIMYNLSWFMVIVPLVTVFFFIGLLASGKDRPKWRFAFWFALLALVGFSNHLYLPIRSALNPMIDEGHPVINSAAEFPWVNIKPLQEVLDRKQYGNESMVSRSFHRRGTLAHQFGIEGHMGFGGFHLLQFYHFKIRDQERSFLDGTIPGFGKLLVYLIPTLLMLLGWYLMTKMNRKAATLLISITVLTTVGMVWYMNFADGSQIDNAAEQRQWEEAVVRAQSQGQQPPPKPTIYREVRVRDYFYSTGFMFFSMWMGLAAGLVLYKLFTDKNSQTRTLAAPVALVLFAVSPALPLAQNYQIRDRSQNWLPFEYAFNLLMSCDKDGILFTNGDNDTFPLWAIQEAYGVRQDVRLVNLSLVNTDWYIKQLKKVEPRVPISYTDRQIEQLQPQYNPFEGPTPIDLTNAKIHVTVPGRDQQQVLRVQDKMVLNIVDATAWSKPVYMAASVSPDNFMGLDPYLQMQGMVYRVYPKPLPANERVDVDRMANMLDKVYKLRPFPNRIMDKDEPYEGIANDYAICFMWFAMQMQERMAALDTDIKALQKQYDDPAQRKKMVPADTVALTAKRVEFGVCFNRALEKLDRCVSLYSWNMQPALLRHQILVKFGQPKMAEERARKLLLLYPDNNELRQMLAQALDVQGKTKEAREIMQTLPLTRGTEGQPGGE